MSDELNLDALVEQLTNVVPLGLPGVTPLDTQETSSWVPVPLSRDVEQTDPPTLLRVAGGRRLLYPGRTHSIVGESSSGKTWVAVLVALEVLENGGRVLWLDYETNAHEFVERLQAMRVVEDEWWSRIHYLNPSHQLQNQRTGAFTSHAVEFARLLDTTRYDLAVIDSVTGAMSAEGLDTNSDADVETFHRLLAYRLANAGPAVLMLDHVVKNRENRGDDARGSGRKREGITGASYVMRVTSPWRRATTSPVTGGFSLRVAKDRPGWVGAIGDTVATGTVISDPDGGLRIALSPSDDVVIMPRLETLRAIVDVLRRFPGTTKRQLEDETEGKAETIRHALKWLQDGGAVTVETSGRGHRLYLDEVRLQALDVM
jgi:hypothetical protein